MVEELEDVDSEVDIDNLTVVVIAVIDDNEEVDAEKELIMR